MSVQGLISLSLFVCVSMQELIFLLVCVSVCADAGVELSLCLSVSLQELIVSYSTDLSLPAAVVSSVLEDLRQHACTKLTERRCKSTGLVSLRVKLVRNTRDEQSSSTAHATSSPLSAVGPTSPSDSDDNNSGSLDAVNVSPTLASTMSGGSSSRNSPGGAGSSGTLEINVESSGRDLRMKIAEMLCTSADGLKLIVLGRVINDEQTLQQQHVKVSIAHEYIILYKCSIFS